MALSYLLLLLLLVVVVYVFNCILVREQGAREWVSLFLSSDEETPWTEGVPTQQESEGGLHWTGKPFPRGHDTKLCSPSLCAPHSPDLAPLNSFLFRGFVQDIVYREKSATFERVTWQNHQSCWEQQQWKAWQYLARNWISSRCALYH